MACSPFRVYHFHSRLFFCTLSSSSATTGIILWIECRKRRQPLSCSLQASLSFLLMSYECSEHHKLISSSFSSSLLIQHFLSLSSLFIRMSRPKPSLLLLLLFQADYCVVSDCVSFILLSDDMVMMKVIPCNESFA